MYNVHATINVVPFTAMDKNLFSSVGCHENEAIL